MTDELATRDAPGGTPAGDLGPVPKGIRPEEAPAGIDPRSLGRRRTLVVLAWVLAALSFVAPIARSGLWDPHELNVAELARRIAVALMGAGQLAIEGGVNDVPTTGELGRGELPFSAVALGFRLFGLYDWAGRLPLALAGIAGCGALYLLLARLVDRIAGSFAVIVLATTPLYFLQARTMLGDIVTMAAFAMALSGLALLVFDDRVGRLPRALYGLLALSGLALGIGARGLLVSGAAPCLSVGLAWLLTRSAGDRRYVTVLGAGVLVTGAIGLVVGGHALSQATPAEFSRLVGTQIAPPAKLLTHDFIIGHLGHALFPWSALIPFAIGRALVGPAGAGSSGDARDTRNMRARMVCMIAGILGLGVHGILAGYVGLTAFAPVGALAGIVAIALRDFERGAPASRSMAIGVAALAVLFYTDFKNAPEKGLAGFAVQDASFPESFKETATRVIKYGTLAMAGLFFAATMDGPSSSRRPFLVKEEYGASLRALRRAYRGNLQFLVILVETGLILLAALMFASDHYLHIPVLEKLSGLSDRGARFGFLIFPLLLLLPWAGLLARDLTRAIIARLPMTRASVAITAIAAFGSALSFWYYPALAAQISPKGVFSSYRTFAGPKEPLGMLGRSAGSATYYAGRQVQTFAAANQAFEWLVADESERRWVVVGSSELPALNASYRERFKRNLPVLDGESSEILLVSNRSEAGEPDHNPFSEWILDEEPTPGHRLDVIFGGQLRCLGWEMTDLDGVSVDAIDAGKPYQVRLYYAVDKAVVGDWKTFIHIDGHQRRYNGDHDTLEGKYPMRYFRAGDYVVDIHEIRLEPNFAGGEYELFFGFFAGARRYEVSHGAHSDNRVRAGVVRVR
jgi:hypothetical protein